MNICDKKATIKIAIASKVLTAVHS